VNGAIEPKMSLMSIGSPRFQNLKPIYVFDKFKAKWTYLIGNFFFLSDPFNGAWPKTT
jgi:hypothetical protein